MKTRLDQQVAIVTGGARGIGLAIARVLAARGARVVVWDRDLSPLQANDFTPALAETVDVTGYDDLQRAFNATVEKFGAVQILVNNAGINGPIAPTWEYSLEDWDRVIAIDMTSVFYTSRIAARHMRAQGYGRIVNIASIAGKEGNPNAAHYSASKAGVIALTKSLGKELATANITVNAITPAVIATDILLQMPQSQIDYMLAKIPMGRLGKKEEAAALVAWLCSEDCSFTTAAVFDLSGGRATY